MAPVDTYIGQLVVTATNSAQIETDKQIVRKICLTINASPDKWMTDTLKTLKHCWTQSVKTGLFLSACHVLEVLDACILSCGNIFRVLVLRQGLLRELTKSLGQLNTMLPLQNKLLTYIQVWGVSFADVPGLTEYDHIYQELKSKKYVFWPVDPKKVEPYRRALVKDQLSAPPGGVNQPVRRDSPQPGPQSGPNSRSGRRGSPQSNPRSRASPSAAPGPQIYRPTPLRPQHGIQASAPPQSGPRPSGSRPSGSRPPGPTMSGQRSSGSRAVSARYPAENQQTRPPGRQSRPRSYHPPSGTPNSGPRASGPSTPMAIAQGPSPALQALKKELAKAKIQWQLAHDLLQTQDSADSLLDRELLKELQIGCVGCQKKLLFLLQSWDQTDELLGDVFRMNVELHSTIIRCKDILLRPQAPPSYYSVASPRPVTPPPSYDMTQTPLIPDLAPPIFNESQSAKARRKAKSGKNRNRSGEAPPIYQEAPPTRNGNHGNGAATEPATDITNKALLLSREMQSLTQGDLIDFDTTPPNESLQELISEEAGADMPYLNSENLENLDNENREIAGSESYDGASDMALNDQSSAEGYVDISSSAWCDINNLDSADDLGSDENASRHTAKVMTGENISQSDGAENVERRPMNRQSRASVESSDTSDPSVTDTDSSTTLSLGGMTSSQASASGQFRATQQQDDIVTTRTFLFQI